MSIRKTLLAIVCITACSSVYAQQDANDVSANLQVTGTVHDAESDCSIALSASNIALQTKSISQLPSQSTTASTGTTDSINIKLTGDSCDPSHIKFIGDTDSTAGDTLVNSLATSSAAKGVGVGIYDYSGHAISLNKAVPATWDLLEGNIPLHLQLVKLTGESPTAGDIQASLTVQLENL